jgi:hypothetical protein
MAINSDGGVRISDLIEGIGSIYGRFVYSRGESFYCDKLSGSLLAEKLEGRSKPLSKEEQVLTKKAKLLLAPMLAHLNTELRSVNSNGWWNTE